MARSLMLGNGEMLVGLDQDGQVRDLYYPHVGLENHISSRIYHRIGVYVDGHLSWWSDPEWKVSVLCASETHRGRLQAVNDQLGLEITATDVVYNEKNILVRRFSVSSSWDETKEVKLFFTHEFHISESERGDTGYFDPRSHSLIHYKGKRVFSLCAYSGDQPFSEYTVGLFNVPGHQGSYKDAEDGELSGNPIEHSQVDSGLGLTLQIEPGVETIVHYWLCAGKSIQEVHSLHSYIRRLGPDHLIETTSDFWQAWANRREFDFYNLDEPAVRLYHQSLFTIRAHADKNGSIIASGDSDMLHFGRDTYSYMWPRDGAYAALALLRAGDVHVARRFFEFCAHVLMPDGYLMHKYQADGSLGSSWHPWVRDGNLELPIQEDETAIVLYALRRYYDLTKDIEFIEEIYNSFVKKIGIFLANFLHESTGLPYPSYNLWENDYGVFTYTCATKYAGLESAKYFANLLGKEDDEQIFSQASASMKEVIMQNFYDDDLGRFIKSVHLDEQGEVSNIDTSLDASSTYGIYRMGVLPVSDHRLSQAMAELQDILAIPEKEGGGMPRYEHDDYYHQAGATGPNAWVISTLWQAQYDIAKAQGEGDLAHAKSCIDWAVSKATDSGMLPEQISRLTGRPLSATPLVWSHACFVNTVIDYLEKLHDLGICETCYPFSFSS